MTKEYKNVSANYLSDTEINVNNKKYIIHNVIDGEDILVNFDTKYPSLEKILKPSKERINDGCYFLFHIVWQRTLRQLVNTLLE